MERRDFLKRAVPVTVLPMMFGGYTLRAFGRSPILEALTAASVETYNVLVLIQLNGGNDGLNTVIPLDQYPAIMAARSNIALPEASVLRLTDATGLHPAMTGLQSLYNNGNLCVVQGVSYPNPNFSHFQATDIWLTGEDSNQSLTSGWMGRYLDQEYPDYPNGYPNAVMPDPLAIQIGSVVSTGLQGPSVSMGMAITSPTSFYQLVSGAVDVAPNTPAGHELTFLREVVQQTQQYATVIQQAASRAKNQSTLYPAPGTNSLADQLKIVAQLVAGGLRTRLYVVNLGGFDTHSAQVNTTTGTDTGTHATLLGKLSTAIAAFEDDCTKLLLHDRVIGMTFSEFGRRIMSNASAGTDHGTSAPMFIFGGKISPGLIGTNPALPAQATVGDNLPMQFDFRSVYASILRQWFGVGQTELEAILLRDYQSLPVIAPTLPARDLKHDPLKWRYAGETGGNEPQAPALGQNFPNPFNPTTQIPFISDGSHIVITIYDALGREVANVADGVFDPGEHSVTFDAGSLPAGTYFCRMQTSTTTQTRKMVFVK